MMPAPAEAIALRIRSTCASGTNVTIFTSRDGSGWACGVRARQSPGTPAPSAEKHSHSQSVSPPAAASSAVCGE